MKIDPAKVYLLRIAVEQKFGSSLGSPFDFDRLAAEIETAAGQRLGVSTLKRIWGYVKSPHQPTFTTLSVLSRYLGFRDWTAYCNSIQNLDDSEHDSEFSTVAVVNLEGEPVGSLFRLQWDGGKECVIRKIAQPAHFEIVDSHSIKLLKGDVFDLSALAVGQSIYAVNCYRGDRQLGTYIGARNHGVRIIERIEP